MKIPRVLDSRLEVANKQHQALFAVDGPFLQFLYFDAVPERSGTLATWIRRRQQRVAGGSSPNFAEKQQGNMQAERGQTFAKNCGRLMKMILLLPGDNADADRTDGQPATCERTTAHCCR